MNRLAAILVLACTLACDSKAAIVTGLLSDFEDGTTQGWGGGASPMVLTLTGGDGVVRNFLSVGNGGTWATHNTSSAYSGAIDPAVTAFELDIARGASETDLLALRIVLLGPGTTNRWTSGEPEIIPNDGIFRRVRFSILEADLVRVQGTASYDETVADINRVMFRHNPGPPSAAGTPLEGTALLDNIRAIPEPSSVLLIGSPGLLCLRRRRRTGGSPN